MLNKIKNFSNIELLITIVFCIVVETLLPQIYSSGGTNLRGEVIAMTDPRMIRASITVQLFALPALSALIAWIVTKVRRSETPYLRVFLFTMLTIHAFFSIAILAKFISTLVNPN